METGKVLALDWGEKRVGWALSDAARVLAARHGTHEREGEARDLQFLQALIETEGVRDVALGLPANMDGSLGPQAEIVLAVKETLEQRLDLPVHLVDERLTSAEAERVLISGGVSRAKRKGKRDALAATLILQAFLERERRERASPPADDA